MNEKQREYSFKKLEEFELESKKLNKQVIGTTFMVGFTALATILSSYHYLTNAETADTITRLIEFVKTTATTSYMVYSLKVLIESLGKKAGIDTLKIQLELDLALDELKDKEDTRGSLSK